MVRSALLVLFVASASLGGDVATEEKALQGSWLVVKSIDQGKEVRQKGAETTVIVFDGNLIHLREGEEKEKLLGDFKLHPTKEQKGIDIRWQFGDRTGQVDQGCYKIEGKMLTICVQLEAKKGRPKEFVSTPGSGLRLIFLKKL